MIVASEAVDRNDPKSMTLASLLERALDEPFFGPPRVPRAVVVRTRKAAKDLEKVCRKSGIEIRVEKRLPYFEEAFASAEGVLASTPLGPPPYLCDEKMTADLVGELFGTAAQYYDLAPWQNLADSDILRVSLESHPPREVFCSVMGDGGIERGVAIFHSEEALVRALEVFGEFSIAEDDPGNIAAEGAGFSAMPVSLSLTFGICEEMGAQNIVDCLKNSWTIAGDDAYPIALRVNESGELATLRPEDVSDLILGLRSVSALIENGRRSPEKIAALNRGPLVLDPEETGISTPVRFEFWDAP